LRLSQAVFSFLRFANRHFASILMSIAAAQNAMKIRDKNFFRARYSQVLSFPRHSDVNPILPSNRHKILFRERLSGVRLNPSREFISVLII
jgi:hypothetical protein